MAATRFLTSLRSGSNHVRCRNGSYRGNRDGPVTQPTGSQPRTRNRKLRPPAVQAYQNVGRRIHRWVTKSTRPIAIEPYFSRDDRESLGFALWAGHNTPLEKDVCKNNKSNKNLWKIKCNPQLYTFSTTNARLFDTFPDFPQILLNSISRYQFYFNSRIVSLFSLVHCVHQDCCRREENSALNPPPAGKTPHWPHRCWPSHCPLPFPNSNLRPMRMFRGRLG